MTNLCGAIGAAGGELLAEELSTDLRYDLREGRMDVETFERQIKQRAQLAKVGMGILAFGAQRDVEMELIPRYSITSFTLSILPP